MEISLFKSSIGRLRIASFIEGLSLLVLLFIAMPLKYMAGDPTAVRVVGMIHGVLFILFVLITLEASLKYKWSFKRTSIVLISCVIPFATFVIDAKILKKQQPLPQRSL